MRPCILPPLLRRLGACGLLITALAPAAAAAYTVLYVDTASRVIPASAMKHDNRPQPVTLHFEVQDNGRLGRSGTEKLEPEVLQQLRDSGLFSIVGTSEGADSAQLSITINRVRATDWTGAGRADNFVCNLRYRSANGSQTIDAAAMQMIYTMSSDDPQPAGTWKTESAREAMVTMTHGVVSHVLDDLSRSPDFH
jgi:hypothetical protein